MALGVFDSGVGGLTVYKELSEAFPETDMIYLGDTARVPYGNKSPEAIIRYAGECAGYLVREYDVNALIVACNTISSHALEPLEKMYGLPAIGVIHAGAVRALQATKNKKIGVIGTRATIQSGKYIEMLANLDPAVVASQKACPLFVPLVEEGIISGVIPELTAKMYLDELASSGIDTLILGCTHYPLLADLIKSLYPHIEIVDSASIVVNQVREMKLGRKESGRREILVTDVSLSFDILKNMLVGDIPVKKVVL